MNVEVTISLPALIVFIAISQVIGAAAGFAGAAKGFQMRDADRDRRT